MRRKERHIIPVSLVNVDFYRRFAEPQNLRLSRDDFICAGCRLTNQTNGGKYKKIVFHC
jgi:hypothetical protein